jgi:hypothetical protein
MWRVFLFRRHSGQRLGRLLRTEFALPASYKHAAASNSVGGVTDSAHSTRRRCSVCGEEALATKDNTPQGWRCHSCFWYGEALAQVSQNG